MIRESAVSGQFYSASKEALERDISYMMPEQVSYVNALGIISPHAGYMYSGKVAAAVYASVSPGECYIILCPNHTGLGGTFSLSLDIWKTPLGRIEVDKDLAMNIKKNAPFLEEDRSAHLYEHAIEVQLPFIQKTAEKCKIVPISIGSGASYEELKELSSSLVKSITSSGKKCLIVASSDMNHYESRERTKEKDFNIVKKDSAKKI